MALGGLGATSNLQELIAASSNKYYRHLHSSIGPIHGFSAALGRDGGSRCGGVEGERWSLRRLKPKSCVSCHLEAPLLTGSKQSPESISPSETERASTDSASRPNSPCFQAVPLHSSRGAKMQRGTRVAPFRPARLKAASSLLPNASTAPASAPPPILSDICRG